MPTFLAGRAVGKMTQASLVGGSISDRPSDGAAAPVSSVQDDTGSARDAAGRARRARRGLGLCVASGPGEGSSDDRRYRQRLSTHICRNDSIAINVDASGIIDPCGTRHGGTVVQQGIGFTLLCHRPSQGRRGDQDYENQSFGSMPHEIKLRMLHCNMTRYFVTRASKHYIKPHHKRT